MADDDEERMRQRYIDKGKAKMEEPRKLPVKRRGNQDDDQVQTLDPMEPLVSGAAAAHDDDVEKDKDDVERTSSDDIQISTGYLYEHIDRQKPVSSDVEADFPKLHAQDFEYCIKTDSIILGRNSETSSVDVDLYSLGGGPNISNHHACIFYDFERHHYALEVLDYTGCFVKGVCHLPGSPPVKLESQDHLRIGDKEFYFLLPVKSILSGAVIGSCGKGSGQLDDNGDGRSRVGREIDNQKHIEFEESQVISSVETVLSGLCGPREYSPMYKVHEKMLEQFGDVWHPSLVSKYLTSEDYSHPDAVEKPWLGLLTLLRKYPQRFIICTRTIGGVTIESVSRVVTN